MERDARGFLERMMAEQRRLAGGAAGVIAGYVVFASTPYVLLDINTPDKTVAYLWASFFDWGLGYLMFLAMMPRGGLTAGGLRTGIGTYFVLGLVIAIPVAVGLIALLLPGLYLLMRWLPAYSRALMTRDGVLSAMTWSWQRTEPWQGPLVAAMILPLALAAIAALAPFANTFVYEHLGRTGIILLSVFCNAVASIGFAGMTVYGIAAYSLLLGQDSTQETEADAATSITP